MIRWEIYILYTYMYSPPDEKDLQHDWGVRNLIKILFEIFEIKERELVRPRPSFEKNVKMRLNLLGPEFYI